MASPTTTSLSSTTSSTSVPSCTTAVPGKYGYVPPEACNANWAYAPSFTAAIAMCVLFGILTFAHISLAVLHRKPFCWVIIMGVAWEFIAFITRSLGAHDQQKLGYAYPSSLLFLLAPLWINAFVYMTAGRLIWTFHPEKKVFGIKAIRIGKYFVWLDILSFLVQGAGGLMLEPGGDAKILDIGKNIYMSGVGLQEFFIVALYAVLALITMRVIFRLVEFSAGNNTSNPLPYKEVYALTLDAFPMLLAALILAVVHPGLALKGPESEFPSRKEKKEAKKAKKAQKKAIKEEKKMGKGFTKMDNVPVSTELLEVRRADDLERGKGYSN
ncbi:hypothetical protein BU24DRAFT_416336 [Aaosphaeria arxii CBS 175.79]|uniref:RTA1-domain-containing protein n=1 Tax=Aaosphaeria arxii CBS 175.79 TaxID=1450172 RepID=A0A6A5Y6L0_9PLEO|nr:uncharacterized protein BU24DRAFT_416336 [Aaosphaeria arxii CBS 175.79]KAF2020657.1 hypothetical protein BU24DRAFT_416336 [Aaosphaeria arxii CBS 175.79]